MAYTGEERRQRMREASRRHYLANREKILARSKGWHEANPDKARRAVRRWEAKNPDKARKMNLKAGRKYRQNNEKKERARCRRYREQNLEKERERSRSYYKINPTGALARWAARHAAKLHATPPWVDRAELAAVYDKAAVLGMTVDHVVPLQHPLVCGLHVPWNLQLLTEAANKGKGNRLVGSLAA